MGKITLVVNFPDTTGLAETIWKPLIDIAKSISEGAVYGELPNVKWELTGEDGTPDLVDWECRECGQVNLSEMPKPWGAVACFSCDQLHKFL